MPDREKLYPRTGDTQTIYLKNAITHPNITVGSYTMYHDYIHSFRFAQAQNVMKIFSLSLFFFIILLVGNSVYYKSRGGEWAVRHAG